MTSFQLNLSNKMKLFPLFVVTAYISVRIIIKINDVLLDSC